MRFLRLNVPWGGRPRRDAGRGVVCGGPVSRPTSACSRRRSTFAQGKMEIQKIEPSVTPVPNYLSRLASQVRAKSQSRFRVATEISSAWAASSSLNPPKKRSSITFAERSSSS